MPTHDTDDLFPDLRRGDEDDPGYDIENCIVVRRTAKAILVRGTGLDKPDPFGTVEGETESWIPLSQLHSNNEINQPGERGTLVITSWLAENRGLL